MKVYVASWVASWVTSYVEFYGAGPITLPLICQSVVCFLFFITKFQFQVLTSPSVDSAGDSSPSRRFSAGDSPLFSKKKKNHNPTLTNVAVCRLFSSAVMSSPPSIEISAWRGRGSLPVVIDITSAIVEIHQTDPYFRRDQPSNVTHSEQMLAMLYCMAILRLVNCVVEKTRKRSEISIAEAADGIGIPRSLIDLRHGMLLELKKKLQSQLMDRNTHMKKKLQSQDKLIMNINAQDHLE